jgi:hypothetical protein
MSFLSFSEKAKPSSATRPSFDFLVLSVAFDFLLGPLRVPKIEHDCVCMSVTLPEFRLEPREHLAVLYDNFSILHEPFFFASAMKSAGDLPVLTLMLSMYAL